MNAAKRREHKRIAVALRVGVIRHERPFIRALRGIVGGIHDTMIAYLEPAIRLAVHDSTRPIHHPSGRDQTDVDAVLRAVMPQIGPKVAAAHTKMTNGLVDNYNSTMAKVLPVGWQRLPSTVQMQAHIAREKSIALVENAARVYAQSVREVFGDPALTVGVRWEDLRDRLVERGDVSESRAELIARDQTLKLNGAINQSHQEAAGVSSYTWSTSNDERVRDEHAMLDGEEFAWTAPPDVGHPGEDICCRCTALPVFDLGDT